MSQQLDNEIIPKTADSGLQTSAKNATLIVYIMYLVGALVVPFAFILVGFIIAAVKKEEYVGTIYYSHMDNLIKIFLYSLGLSVLFGILVFVIIGFVLLGLLYLWFVYQVIIGLLALLDAKPRDFKWI